MDKEILVILNIANNRIEKSKFYHQRTRTFWGDVDIQKTLSKKIFFAERNHKYFIGYLYKSNERLLFSLLIINKY